jgi:hypothetical protein
MRLFLFSLAFWTTTAFAETFRNDSDHHIWIATAGLYDSAPSTHPERNVYYSSGWTGIAPGETKEIGTFYGYVAALFHNSKLYQIHPQNGTRGYTLGVSAEAHNCRVRANARTNTVEGRLEAFRQIGCPIAMKAYHTETMSGGLAIRDAVRRLKDDLGYRGTNIVVQNNGNRTYEFELHFYGSMTGWQKFNERKMISPGEADSWFVEDSLHGWVWEQDGIVRIGAVGQPLSADTLRWGFDPDGNLTGTDRFTRHDRFAADFWYQEYKVSLTD